jgi:hypothetical protein
MNKYYLRELIKEVILLESIGGERLAALINKGSQVISATLYDAARLEATVADPSFEGLGSYSFEVAMINDIMKGVIKIVEPFKLVGQCYDAWQVVSARGAGYGREIYGLAYALSPSRRLVSDRIYVSEDAIDGWRKASSKRKALPLDDYKHEHDDPNEYHTEDPYDDCKVYRGAGMEHLNFAYEANGSEDALLASLTASHARAMARVDPQFMEEFESRIFNNFNRAFLDRE